MSKAPMEKFLCHGRYPSLGGIARLFLPPQQSVEVHPHPQRITFIHANHSLGESSDIASVENPAKQRISCLMSFNTVRHCAVIVVWCQQNTSFSNEGFSGKGQIPAYMGSAQAFQVALALPHQFHGRGNTEVTATACNDNLTSIDTEGLSIVSDPVGRHAVVSLGKGATSGTKTVQCCSKINHSAARPLAAMILPPPVVTIKGTWCACRHHECNRHMDRSLHHPGE